MYIHVHVYACTVHVHVPLGSLKIDSCYSFENYYYNYSLYMWVCCVTLPCCLFDLACFFFPSFSSLIMYMYVHMFIFIIFFPLTLDLLVRCVKPVIQDFIMVIGRERARNAPINSLFTSTPTLQHTSAHTRARSHSVWL